MNYLSLKTGNFEGQTPMGKKINGRDILTSEKAVTVNFPTATQIAGVSTLSSNMSSEWASTLVDCTDTQQDQRRERGFWISLNTATNTYSCGSSIKGAWADYDEGALIDAGTRPGVNNSTPNANDSGAIYAVAFFHTHTPTTYRKEGQTRTPGIGGNDPFAAEMKNVGVIVYDYSTSSTIGRGYPENAPAKLYYFGQRSIESGKE